MPVARTAPRTRNRRVLLCGVRFVTQRHISVRRRPCSVSRCSPATAATSGKTSSVTCPGVLTIATQAGNHFSGSFAIQSGQGCDAQQGTVAGTVQDDGSVSFTADTPGGGSNVWEDAAERTHCRLVSGSTFDGTVSSAALTATGRGVYSCPLVGTVRASVSFQVSATQS